MANNLQPEWLTVTEPSPFSSPHKHIHALDGFRGLACFVVVLFHASALTWLGYNSVSHHIGHTGVMVFFVLSGFLMCYHYLPGQANWRYWLAFLVRRFFRIYPAYFLTTLAVWLISQLYPFLFALWFYGFDTELLLMHWVGLRGWTIFWTVVIELQFYLLLVPLALGLLALPKKLRLPALLLLWLSLLVFVRDIELRNMETPMLHYYLSAFIGGMVMASYHRDRPMPSAKGVRLWNLLALMLPAALAFELWRAEQWPDAMFEMPVWRHAYFFVPVISLLTLCMVRANGLSTRFFSLAPLRFIAKISFSFYLTHVFVFLALQNYRDEAIWFEQGVAAWGIALLLGWLMYKTIEAPGDRLGRKIAGKIHDQG